MGEVNLTQLFLQLGIAGGVLLVGYRIALRVIEAWRESEKERNLAWAKAEGERTQMQASTEAARTAAIQAGFNADVEAHSKLVEAIQALNNRIVEAISGLTKQFSRIEGKIDAVMDYTPVREMRAAHAAETAAREADTPRLIPPERSTPIPARSTTAKGVTPPQGWPTTYGPEKPGRSGK